LLLIFIRAFESFEIPALVGLPGDIRVLTTSILLDAQRMPPTYGRAGAFAVLLMLVVACTLYFYFRMTREASRFHTITGKGYRPALIQLGGWRYVTAAGLLLYAFVLLVLPFLIVLWASLLPFYIQPSGKDIQIHLEELRDGDPLPENYRLHQEQRPSVSAAPPP
jgi:iron(III) transport system permease protein